MEFDVRRQEEEEITSIVFSRAVTGESTILGYQLQRNEERGGHQMVSIRDRHAFVLIESAEHAMHLKAALDKAIALGWIK